VLTSVPRASRRLIHSISTSSVTRNGPGCPKSHASDIVVTWPDGHETNGIARHIDDLKGMFVYAPNTNIAVHPIRICSGDYTAVIGIMTGTFSRPMPTGDGKTVAPTGKSFRLTMATIGHWKGATMDHEWLFWDNDEFMRRRGSIAHRRICVALDAMTPTHQN